MEMSESLRDVLATTLERICNACTARKLTQLRQDSKVGLRLLALSRLKLEGRTSGFTFCRTHKVTILNPGDWFSISGGPGLS